MLKRKYADRPEWKRVLNKEYVQTYLDTTEFKGYVTLLKIHKVSEPLSVRYDQKSLCIVDDGYSWLQHFPTEAHYSLTTMFDSKGEIVQWYIDICQKNGIENGIPYMDDLFLDIVVLPTGEVILKDADEIKEALSYGMIEKALYNLAWEEANSLIDLVNLKAFDLLKLSGIHKKILLRKMNY